VRVIWKVERLAKCEITLTLTLSRSTGRGDQNEHVRGTRRRHISKKARGFAVGPDLRKSSHGKAVGFCDAAFRLNCRIVPTETTDGSDDVASCNTCPCDLDRYAGCSRTVRSNLDRLPRRIAAIWAIVNHMAMPKHVSHFALSASSMALGNIPLKSANVVGSSSGWK
jgi:hypothetical protein